MSLDGTESSVATADYLDKMLTKQAEIVLFHVKAEAPEVFRDLRVDPVNENEDYPLIV
jgi:hypothetical protein